MDEGKAKEYLSILQKPRLDNVALIEEFGLAGPERAAIRTQAREALLDDPDLAWNPRGLQQAVRERLR
jgi:hypothetical protein